MLDILVAIAVITILIAILSPTLGKVQESSRKVVCASNLRQFGLGMQMYADDSRGSLPPSAFLAEDQGQQAEMMTVRLAPDHRIRMTRNGWDGLGILFKTSYLKAPGLYYCPSHHGEHPFERYASVWARSGGEIVGNYHFRGQDSEGLTNLYMMLSSSALAADGMRTLDDYNHRVGLNVLRVGGSVAWMDDSDGEIMAMLAEDDDNVDSASVNEAWDILDHDRR